MIPKHAYFAGPSAAYLLGVDHAATFQEPVHLLIPAGTRLNARQPTVVHRATLTPGEHLTHRGFPVTTPPRTCWDLTSWLDAIKAVTIIDALLRGQLVTMQELTDLVGQRLGLRGARRAQKIFDYADAGAQSPAESALRVRLALQGFPRPRTQFPVPVNGTLLHPDLGWPDYLVAVEYDGLWHNEAEQFHQDRRRLNLLTSAGWAVIYVTSRRMRTDFAGVVNELREVLMRRGWDGRLRRPT